MLNVASFFSGCGGFDLGFQKAGFNILLANDNWHPASESYKHNFPDTRFIYDNIKNIGKEDLNNVLETYNIEKFQVVIGGPPCQCFTRLNNNKLRKNDERNELFREYVRLIKILKPEYVIMENVADLLVRKNEKGQYFKDLICKTFNRAGYRVSYNVFETEKFGVPQKRRRVIFIATSKKDVELTFPNGDKEVETVKNHLDKLKLCESLGNHEFRVNGPEALEKIKNIPQGGYYAHLPDHLKTKKIRDGKLVTVKRYGSYYRRLHPNEPAVTITRNYVIHPTEDRYLSNREKAMLHTFPPEFYFFGTMEDVSIQIANSVPPEFSRRIAEHIKSKIEC